MPLALAAVVRPEVAGVVERVLHVLAMVEVRVVDVELGDLLTLHLHDLLVDIREVLVIDLRVLDDDFGGHL